MTKKTEDQKISEAKLPTASAKNDATISVSNRAVDRARLNEVANLLWRHRDLDDEEVDLRIATALDFLVLSRIRLISPTFRGRLFVVCAAGRC